MFADRKQEDREEGPGETLADARDHHESPARKDDALNASLPADMRGRLEIDAEDSSLVEDSDTALQTIPTQEKSFARSLLRTAHKVLDKSFSLIASDPRAEASLIRVFGNIGVDVIPFVGPIKKYADARELYKEKDPVLQEEGRRLCVIALAEMALDIGTMGGSAFLPDELITGMRTLGDYHRRLHAVTKESTSIKDPASLIAGLLLKVPGLKTTVDALLQAPEPDTDTEASQNNPR